MITSNIDILDRPIWVLILLLLCVCWFVDPTIGLAQAQESPTEAIEVPSSQADVGTLQKELIIDVTTLLRAVFFPFLLWLLRSLIIYNFERFHTVGLLKKDIKSRTFTTKKAIRYLDAWLSAAKTQDPKNLPYLRTESETHLIFPSVQDSMKKILWRDEFWAVRSFYRNFDEVEIRAANIARLYAHFMEEKECENSWYIGAIQYNRDYINMILEAYLPNNNESEERIENTDKESEKFFFSTRIYILLFALPFSLLISIGWTIEELLTESETPTYAICTSVTLLATLCISYIILDKYANKRIRDFHTEIESKKEEKINKEIINLEKPATPPSEK